MTMARMSYAERRSALEKALAPWEGKTFGLRRFPGETFRMSKQDSYMDDEDRPCFYTEIRREDGTWGAFAKGSLAELQREIVGIVG